MYAVMADSTQAIEMLLNFSAKREQVKFQRKGVAYHRPMHTRLRIVNSSQSVQVILNVLEGRR